MSSAPYHPSIGAARADALFASPLQRSDDPGRRQVRQAIAAALGAYGMHGCAARVVQAYGEHPRPRSGGCAGRGTAARLPRGLPVSAN
jgi:hypothetical protein